MKRTIKELVIGIGAVSLLLSNAPQSVAQTNDDLKAVQDLVEKQGQQIQQLLKERAEDHDKIQHLEQLVGEASQKAAHSEQVATNAQQKAEETQKATAEVAANVQTMQSAPSEESSAKQNFVVTGYAHALYDKLEGQNGSFLLGSFSPIFLFRASDKVLFEGELELGLETDTETGETETEVELEYAQIDYAYNDYVTFIAGKFLLPLGVFPEKLHPAWINKLPTMPLPYTGLGGGHHGGGIVPFSDVGVQARGALHLGESDAVMTYAAILVNGPSSELEDDGMGGVEEEISFESGRDLNGTPSGGGRIAVFYPWSAYHDLEVGLSGETGTWNRDDDLSWSAIVADASLHLGPYTELRGEYLHTWLETEDEGTLQPQGAWVQIAYKLAGLQLEWPLISNCEAVFRWDYLDSDMMGTKTHGYSLGLNYYVSNTLLVKGAYEFISTTDEDNENNRLTFQIAYGF